MTENVSEAKSRLRTQVLTKRSQALASDTANVIGSQLLKLCEQLGARTVGIYLSFGSEPVTDVFVIGAKAAGITLFAPRTGPESTMEFARLEGATESSELGFLQPVGEVIELVKELINSGCYEVSLGDTIGVGTPRKIRALLQSVSKEVDITKIR